MDRKKLIRQSDFSEHKCQWSEGFDRLIPPAPEFRLGLDQFDAYENGPFEDELTRNVVEDLARKRFLVLDYSWKYQKPLALDDVHQDRLSFFCGLVVTRKRKVFFQKEQFLLFGRILLLHESGSLFPELWGFEHRPGRAKPSIKVEGTCLLCSLAHPFDSHFPYTNGDDVFVSGQKTFTLRDLAADRANKLVSQYGNFTGQLP
jgi:hypothetical protein